LKSPFLALSFALFSLIQPPQARAQGLPGVPDTSSQEVTESAEIPTPVAQEHASPRATLRSFLVAFDTLQQADGEVNFSQAIACLDLSEIPRSLRGQEGPKRAVELKDVLDRTRLIDFEEIPDDPAGDPYVFLRRSEGDVIIAPAVSGEWLFTAATLEALPRLWQATREQEIVEGVTEAPRTLALWMRSQIPPSWQKVAFLLERWQWLGLLILIGFGAMASRGIVGIFRRIVLRVVRRRMPEAKAHLLDRAARPLAIATMGIIWWLGLVTLDLPLNVLKVLHYGIWLLTIVALVWLAYRLVDILSTVMTVRAAKTAGGFDDLLVPLIRKAIKVIITVFAVAFIADNLDIEISSLLAGLGLGGLAMALAAQDTVKNLFGSLTVLLDRPFEIGDSVVIDGVAGSIEEVGIRSTRIRTFENSLVTLPNSNLISAAVDNKGARVYRRWSTTLSFTYDSSPEKLEAFCEGARELIRQHPHTRKDAIYVYLNSLGASSLDVLLYLFFDTKEWNTELQSKHQLALAFLRLAERLGLDFAFPTQTLHVHQEENPQESKSPENADDLTVQARQFAQELARSGKFSPREG